MGSLLRLWRLSPFVRPYIGPYAWGMVGLVAARIFEGATPLLLRAGIDSLRAQNDALLLPVLGITACVLARFGCISASRRSIRSVGVHATYDLRTRIYAHLQRQAPSFFARHATGDLMARAINDIGIVRQLLAQGVRTVIVMAFSAVIGFAGMLWLSSDLALLLLLPLPFITLTTYRVAGRIYAASVAVQEGFSGLSERVQENLNGIRTIQAHVQEQAEIARFGALNRDYARRYLALVRSDALLSALMLGLGAACTLMVLGFGGARVLADPSQFSAGTFVAFFSYLGMLLWPVREAGPVVQLFQRSAAAADRLFEVLDHAPEIAETPVTARGAPLRGALELRDLSYRYPGASHLALEHVTLHAEPGETIALLGPIGAGKSTLLRLLVRLLDPPPGSVFIDGVDVRELPLAQVRASLALIPQDPFLFADTARANLSYDDPSRGDPRIWSAADDAALRATLESLPAQLDALLGERGVNFSGGQKQRATLARGLIRGAPVLLLDDCLSSVDTETEEHILDRLAKRRGQHTTVLISHRVSTVRSADRIYLLDAGRIVEQGTHAQLLARGGAYAALQTLQRRRQALQQELETLGTREAAS
jgi:ATP-binding cassette, subfamily B, multidrug efflux pump